MLTVNQFNSARYFGYDGNMPGGYGRYMPTLPHQLWKERAEYLINECGLSGSVLELGCAMGGWTRELRDLGINTYGLDLPWPIQYAIENLWPELEPYLIMADARNYLQGSVRRQNEWDFIISWNFLECLSDRDLGLVVPRLNYTANRQIHIIDPRADEQFYTKKSLEEWKQLGFKPGSIFLDGC